MAQSLHRSGRLDEARRAYLSLLEQSPDPDARHGLALLYNQTGRDEEALPLIHAVLEQDPGAVSSRLVLARCLAALGRLDEAVNECRRAADQRPDIPAAWNLLGQLMQQAGDPNAARDYLRRALEIDPANGPAQHNLGITLSTLGDQAAAIAAYRKALTAMPMAARVYYNLALALQGEGREQEAIAALERAIELRPDHAEARLRLTQLRLLNCDWDGLDDAIGQLESGLGQLLGEKAIGHLSIHVLNLLSLPASLHRDLARRLAREIDTRAHGLSMAAPVHAVEQHRRTRIAYVSPDLGAHAVGGLLAGFFAHHDRNAFEVSVYSLRRFNDAIARSIQNGAERYVDLSELSLADSASAIIAGQPDILVDLGGYTQGARTEIVALRPAPVQVSWLGYLNTMGASFIDYLIADPIVIPEAEDADYDEAIARLPRCFLPASRLEVSPQPLTREEAGLPADAFVFASFNNPCKIDPPLFEAWMRILHQAPGSVLWIYDGNRESVRENLGSRTRNAGLDAARLVFAPPVSMDLHLGRMALADLFLDAFGYNAGATAIAATQAGLPVLTRRGNSLLARMGASINEQLGLPELVCADTDQYVASAVALGADRTLALDLRERVAAGRERKGGLFDLEAYVADLEGLYRLMLERHRSGGSPGALSLDAASRS